MAKWIAAEKARAGLRHTVVWPNVTGETKARRGKPRAGVLALVCSAYLTNSHKWRELASSGLICRVILHVIFLWCYVCF